MQDTMSKNLWGHVRYHTKICHHKITHHPRYALVSGHALEIAVLFFGSFFAFSFGSTGSLPSNDSFSYPMSAVSHPTCKRQHFSELSGKCLTTLPRIKGAKYAQYKDSWPLNAYYSILYGSSYEDGWARNGGHTGVDFSSSEGTPLLSIGDGVVVMAGFNKGGYGNVVKVKYRTPDNKIIFAIYGHMEKRYAKTGQKVTRGQVLGTLGNTGNSFGAHLHFEIVTTDNGRGLPIYPYLNCPEKNIYKVNNTSVCKHLLLKYSDDPIEFLEKYHTAGSSDPVDSHPSPPIEGVNPKIVISKTHQGDRELSPLYGMINQTVPSLDVASLTQKAQEFLKTYEIKIIHKLSTKTKIGRNAVVELSISHKKTKRRYTGKLPVPLNFVSVNGNLSINPNSLTSVRNGYGLARIRGVKRGAGIVGITFDNQIIHAFPVLVK